jgi:hypothetical protein
MSERLAVAVPLSRETAFSDGKQIEDWTEYAWSCAPADADAVLKGLPADAALAPLWRGKMTAAGAEVVVMRFRTRTALAKPRGVDAVAEDVARGVVGVFA